MTASGPGRSAVSRPASGTATACTATGPALRCPVQPGQTAARSYARAITGGVDYRGPILDHTDESDYEPDQRDSFNAVPLGVVVADTPPPTPLAAPIPMTDTVLYELHVKGFTRLHPDVDLRGTYAGLAYPR